MAGMVTANMDAVTRSELWSTQLKDILMDKTAGTNYVRWLSEFPDGTTFTIPSIGALDAYDYTEGQPVVYTGLDTGEFQFSITTYLATGTSITRKAKQDSFYSSEIISSFIPKQARAIEERLETDILKEGQPKTGTPAGYQTVANNNLINNGRHRWVGSDVLNGKRVLAPQDFAEANFSLNKANVPTSNRVAIVDPSTVFVMETQTNLVNLSNNKMWEGIIATGISGDMQFKTNIYGFDVYTSNRLPKCGVNQTGLTETIDTVASGTDAVANLFFSAAADVLPFIGAWRQMPNVDTDFNKDLQQDEFVTTCRYGIKIYRPENLISVLSNPTAVYA
jgi:hypothetical protein